MAGNSLLVLIDDIATLLDDVAVMSKAAAKKTAGVLGDDLALNAQQVTGLNANRELSVVWAVAKGSFVNKCILVPAALVISVFAPWLIVPLLMIGGLYLCYEGSEKIIHALFYSHEAEEHHRQLLEATGNTDIDLIAFEKEKIKGAIRTDFILSAEIIAISLGVVSNEPLVTQAATLATVALLITIFVYGLVAGIVRLDDWGLYLHQKEGSGFFNTVQKKFGFALLQTVPYLMKGLTFIGTVAMFLVGGGILTHGLSFLHHGSEYLVTLVSNINSIGPLISAVTPIIYDGIIGLIAGVLCFILIDLLIKPLFNNAST